MTYIKLLTVLAGLALLTACGGAAAPETTPDDSGGDNPCKTNAFQAECNASDPAIMALRETQCLADTTIDPSCTGETGIATVFCKDTPFDTNCNAVETAIISRQNQCLGNDAIHSTCGAVIVGVCEANPFQTTACLPGETYLPNRIAACIKYSELDMADKGNCRIITNDPAKNPALIACLANPFATACEASESAFSTYAETAQTNLASFCDDSDNATDDFCTGESQMGVCGADPFNAICFTGTTYLSDRVADCIKTENTEAEKCNTLLSNTAMNTTITNCLTNPFTDTCTSNADFMTHATTAQMNRASFCGMAGNGTKALCTGDNVMGVCDINPFITSCFTDDTYLPARLTDCIKTENTEATKCNTLLSDDTMNTAITACLTNPFSDTCEADSDFMTHAETAQTNRVSFCEIAGNESNALCMGANLTNLCGFSAFSPVCTEHPDILDFKVINCLNSGTDPTCAELILVKENDLPAYPALPVATTPTGFLEGGTAGIDTTGFTNRDDSGSFDATATAGTEAAMVSLGGLATDGVAWADIDFTGGGRGFYAGIFSGTNMGAPLVRPASATGAMVEWKGIIQGTDNLIQLGNPTPFTLNVDLYNRTLKAFLPFSTVFAFSIDGNYDAKGLIGGTTLRGQYIDRDIADQRRLDSSLTHSTGTLTGLIGGKGAVAAFHSNTTGNAYAGGFIAVPPSAATHANFKAYYTHADRTVSRTLTTDSTLGNAAFIVGTATSLPVDGFTFPNDNTFMPFTVRLKEASSGDDGFAIMYGFASGDVPRQRAGLLSGTDLGPAVPTTGMATWAGTIYISSNLVSGVPASVPLNLTVNFNAGEINTTTPASNGTYMITVKGRFGSTHSLPDGILGGSVDYASGNGGFEGVGLPLIGLIGTKGVIGVYNGPGFAGGFQASPSE